VKSRQDSAYCCDKNTTNIFTRCVAEFMKRRKTLFEARILHLIGEISRVTSMPEETPKFSLSRDKYFKISVGLVLT
jgi:hypothetical protein